MFYDAGLGSDEKQQWPGFDFRLELSVEHSAALEDQPSICTHDIPKRRARQYYVYGKYAIE